MNQHTGRYTVKSYSSQVEERRGSRRRQRRRRCLAGCVPGGGGGGGAGSNGGGSVDGNEVSLLVRPRAKRMIHGSGCRARPRGARPPLMGAPLPAVVAGAAAAAAAFSLRAGASRRLSSSAGEDLTGR